MKSKSFLLKLSPEEYHEIKTKAKLTGVSMSKLLRNSVLDRDLSPSHINYNSYCLLIKGVKQLSQLKLSQRGQLRSNLIKQIELTLSVLRQAALKIISSDNNAQSH
jgi:hypothetical protein